MAMLPWWIHYPNVNNEIINLDWILQVSNENTELIKNFIGINTIKYADPILWDITSQYEANTIVVDPQTGDAYISTKAVPYGVALSNDGYWTRIYNYASELHVLREQIAADEQLSTTATAPRSVDDLVFVNGLLYRITSAMIAGDSYVEDSNCVKTTINAELERLHTTIVESVALEAQARADADTALGGRIDNEAQARADADTALGGRIDGEAQARADADTALGQRIDNEAQARADADTALGQRITDEATARENADTAILQRLNPYLIGKKVLVLGDSLAAENLPDYPNWVTLLREKYATAETVIDNFAVSGDTFAGNASTGVAYTFQNSVTDRDYDIIIVEAGINDFFQQFPIGPLNPTDDDISTFNGALVYFNESVRQNNPDADVFFICPPKSEYELDHSIPADLYRLLIYNACNLYGWHFIDAYAEEPFLSIYTDIRRWTDGIHPLYATYAPILMRYFEQRINNFGGNYFSYAKSRMSLTAFCTDVYTNCTLALEFDTNQQAILTVSCTGMTFTEAQGITLAKIPSWLKQVYTTYAHATLNGVYLENVQLLNGEYVQLVPNRTGNGNIYAQFNIPLNLTPIKAYA